MPSIHNKDLMTAIWKNKFIHRFIIYFEKELIVHIEDVHNHKVKTQNSISVSRKEKINLKIKNIINQFFKYKIFLSTGFINFQKYIPLMSQILTTFVSSFNF